jgi:mevalonate kinase
VNLDLLIISSILILGFGIVIYLINRKQTSNTDTTVVEWLKSMDKRLDSNSAEVNTRLNNAATAFASVQKSLGEMSEIGRNMKSLQEFLNSPKLRGNIGEQVLKELLAQFLPKNAYKIQHRFKSGSIVDAAIITEAGLIPIDSKFPMENFKKMHATDDQQEKKLFQREYGCWLTTPTCVNMKGTRPSLKFSQGRLPSPACLAHKDGGKPNPIWGEWLMGWVIGWTGLEQLETDRFQQWLQEHGGC